jgi:hypothetical protein
MRVEVFKAIKKRHAAARTNPEPSRTSHFLNLIFLSVALDWRKKEKRKTTI